MTTSGAPAENGPRNVGQCSTSTPSRAAGAGTRARRRASVAARATSPGRTTAHRHVEVVAAARGRTARCRRASARAASCRALRESRGTPRGRSRRPAATRTARACSSPRARSSSRRAERLADRRRERLGALRVGAHGSVAAGLVHRRVRRGDDRCARGHRLGDRHAEALEARRIDDRGGAAVEPRELLVGDAAEPHDAGHGRAAAAAPSPAPPTTASESSVSPSSANASTSVPRFLRGSSVATVSRYGAPRSAASPSARNSAPMPGCATTIRSRGKPSVAAMSSAVNAELANSDVAGAGGVAYLRPCIERVRPVTHSGKCSGHEIVDRRRAHTGALRRVHPVGEVQHVEAADEALGGRPAEHATSAVRQRVRAGQRDEPQLDVEPVERLAGSRAALGRVVGANATISCPRAAPTLDEAARASRGCSC